MGIEIEYKMEGAMVLMQGLKKKKKLLLISHLEVVKRSVPVIIHTKKDREFGGFVIDTRD